MSENRLTAEARTEFGKGGARRTRRAGKIPAVLYGHGADPQHLSLPLREFTAAVRNGGANVLLTLDVSGTEFLAIPKSIQRHALRDTYDHIDLLAVRRGEKVNVDVAIVLVGEVAPGALLQQETSSLTLEAEATNIPTEVTINVEGLAVGAQISAGDLELPAGSALTGDADELLIVVSEAPSEAALDAAVTASENELGIVEDKSQAEIAAESGGAAE